MKTLNSIGLVLITIGFSHSAMALDAAELDLRVRTLTTKFESLQRNPEKAVPADTLRQARGIVLLDRTKAGFLFAYQGGGGVALVRNMKTDKWGAGAFVGANEASLGFQVGGEQGFYVILFMTTNSTRLLTEPNFSFGGEARGTVADTTSGVEGVIHSPERPVLVFDDRKGLYGGAAIKGGAIAADDRANLIYYGQLLSMQDILFNSKVPQTPAIAALAEKLEHGNLAAH